MFQTSDTNSAKSTSDATKGKAKKKKVKQNSNGSNSSSNDSSSSKTNPTEQSTKKAESSKKANFVQDKVKGSPKKDYSVSSNSQTSKNDKNLTNSTSGNSLITQKSASPKKDAKNKQQQKPELNTSRSDTCLVNSKNVEFENGSSNSSQRKRSEIKINSLNSTNNNNFNALEDFPALGSSTSKPPGFSNPPPGFSTAAPPPGFFVKLNNVKRLQNDNGLTFTNSSGESYSIVPDNDKQSKYYAYISPPDFQKRNQGLVAKVSEVLGDQEQIEEFRNLSGLFRKGICDAEDYYKRCRAAMGSSTFESVFSELLVLLPDIKKQQELFKVHKKEVNGQIRNLELCATCDQILKSADLQSHLSNHTFPALGETIPDLPNNTWVRK